MKTEFHPANERGHAIHGWLDSYHSFSFADYFNPARDRFGALRVLNDDTIEGGTGFGEHPHDNMEIISIPLEGELEHRDSMGHIEVIRPGEVQVMSAGTGIRHSEYNHSQNNPSKFLQIWIYTRTRNVTPRYDQKAFDIAKRNNSIQCIVSPDNQLEEESLFIHQDAWISIAKLDSGNTLKYKLFKKDNVAFIFIIEGDTIISGQPAGRRDAVGIRETELIDLISYSESEILIIEVPEK
jgi:redox-sensitive bicupin YhaK (pirin superfamily)